MSAQPEAICKVCLVTRSASEEKHWDLQGAWHSLAHSQQAWDSQASPQAELNGPLKVWAPPLEFSTQDLLALASLPPGEWGSGGVPGKLGHSQICGNRRDKTEGWRAGACSLGKPHSLSGPQFTHMLKEVIQIQNDESLIPLL